MKTLRARGIASIIVPACNEAATIGRCLETLLEDARPDEFEVIVVCNGCRDGTGDVARDFEHLGVTVLETPIASKPGALNIGDRSASHFPRLYLDADIRLATIDARKLVEFFLENPDVFACTPVAWVDTSACDPFVRAYYRIWTDLPYFKDNLVGSGLYALSDEGRRSFEQFPDIVSDDEYVRRSIAPNRRKRCSGCSFFIAAPRDVLTLIRVQTRARLGVHELGHEFPNLNQAMDTSMMTTLRSLLRRPKTWLDVPVYATVVCMAEWRARRLRKRRCAIDWARDETNRQSDTP